MKKLLAIILCLILLLGMAACGGKSSVDTPKDETTNNSSTPGSNPSSSGGNKQEPSKPTRDTLKIGIDGDVGTLDPFLSSGSFMAVTFNYCQPLWDTSEKLKDDFCSTYLLGESVEPISDIEYLIHLRQGVTFSNGNPFTAEDVLFTLEYVRDTPMKSYVNFVDFEKTEIVDDNTIRLVLLGYDKTQLVGLSNVPIVDKESYDPAVYAKAPVGTGPYEIVDYVVNSSVTLKARDDYWGGAPAIKNLVYKNIPEASQKVNALETGEIDMIHSCPPADAEYVESMDDVTLLRRGTVQQLNLTFNCKKDGPLATKEARWAIAYAANREGILNVAYNGFGTVAQAPFSASCNDYTDSLANLHDTYKTGYNLELAKKYAEESGLIGKTVILISNGSDTFATTAQIIEQSLKEIGVDAHVQNYDNATVRNMIAAEDGWDVYVANTSNPSGIGLDQIYAQAGKFNRTHIDWNKELFDEFDLGGKAMLGLSDKNEFAKRELEYVKRYEEECLMFGLVDMVGLIAFKDYVVGVRQEVIKLDHIYEMTLK